MMEFILNMIAALYNIDIFPTYMFDPDNFYQVFNENFIDDNTIMYVPRMHGEKQISHYVELVAQKNQSLNALDRNRCKKVFMYDQEPILPGMTDSLKHRFTYTVPFSKWNDFYTIEDAVAVAFLLKNNGFPIWCHSEENSCDVKRLSQAGLIPCFYWYHALIARDWFRHWQFSKALDVKDKSDSTYRFLIYSRDFSGTRGYRRDILNRLRSSAGQISYNWQGSQTIGPEYSAKIDLHDAQSAAIHLVAETLFATDKIYLTEKVFKPMVMSQPFLIFSAPGTLSFLRRYGFRTFDHVWDESYDLIPDHDLRLQTICNLIKELIALPQEEFRAIYHKCLHVIDHNRKHFFYSGFMDQCWQELIDNWSSAMWQAHEKQQSRPWGLSVDTIGQHAILQEIPSFAQMAKNMLQLAGENVRNLAVSKYPALSEL